MSDIYTVDTQGLSCPQPVLMFHQAVKAGHTRFDVLVDNNASRENVTRAAESKGFAVQESSEGAVWRLALSK